MPDIKFNCPHCKQSLEAPDDMLGQLIDCPSCRLAIVVQRTQPRPSVPPHFNIAQISGFFVTILLAGVGLLIFKTFGWDWYLGLLVGLVIGGAISESIIKNYASHRSVSRSASLGARLSHQDRYHAIDASAPERDVGLLTMGYILAAVVPIIGMIFGVYLLFCKNRVGHFFGLLVLSLFFSAFWLGFWAELQPEPVHYWWCSWWYEVRWWSD